MKKDRGDVYRAYQREYHRGYRAKRRREKKCIVCGDDSNQSRCPGCQEAARLKREEREQVVTL
jgi:hypothetical protein